MIRSTLMVLAGVVIGALAVYFVSFDASRPVISQAVDVAQSSLQGASPVHDPAINRVIADDAIASHDNRTNFHRAIGGADESELLAEIHGLALQPVSPSRSYLAEVLLSRYAELEPQKAIDAARAYRFGKNLTATLYAVWARSDASGAMAALKQEPDATIAQRAGLFLVQELGGDSTALLDVVDALPDSVDPISLQIDFIAAAAASDPAGAISQALGFESREDQQLALQRLAETLAFSSPQQGFSAAMQITNQTSRQQFVATLMREWSSMDPSGVLDYLESAGPLDIDTQKLIGSSFTPIARTNPERLLALTEGWSGQYSDYAKRNAIAEWSKEDPDAALAYVTNQPPGRRRSELYEAVAEGFASQDVDAALAWAETLQPMPEGVYRAIVTSVASVDVERAFDIALSLDNEYQRSQAVQSIAMRAVYQDQRGERAASKILSIENKQLREQSLQMLGMMWAQSDAEGAIGWMSANLEQLPESAVQVIARQVGEQDPEMAAKYTDRVPAGARETWISSVATGLAQHDPSGAMAWLSQYQGEPAYDEAIGTIALQSARVDPVASARNIERNPNATYAPTVAAATGQQWAQRDPRSAAAWALRLPNEQTRNSAIAGVAGQWAYSEPENAAQWARTLPRGDARDGALQSVISGTAATRVPDDDLFDAIENDLTRQQAAVSAANRMSRTDTDAADRIIAKYVTDETLLRQFQDRRTRMMLY